MVEEEDGDFDSGDGDGVDEFEGPLDLLGRGVVRGGFFGGFGVVGRLTFRKIVMLVMLMSNMCLPEPKCAPLRRWR